MTLTLMLALLLQLTGIILLRYRLGKTWLRRPVTLLFLASVIYQGVSAVLLTPSSVGAWDYFRKGIAPQYTGDAALLLSAAMLAFVITYLMTKPQRAIALPADPRALARTLDWRVAAALCAPLALLTYAGRGASSGTGMDGAATSLTHDLAATFFTTLAVTAACGAVLRHGTRWFLPVLATQSLILAAAGERGPVLAGAVALLLMLAFVGARPSRAQLNAAAALTILAVLAIGGVRAVQGRTLFYSDSGLQARAAGLGSAVTSLGSGPQQGPGLAEQAATRLDGNAFAAGVLQAHVIGQPRLDPAAVPQSLLITVPSALWPSKLNSGAALDPVQAETDDFGLQQVNLLPTLPGLYAGYLSPPWLVMLLALLGAAAGWGERWLLRTCTPARLVMLAGAVMAVFTYEAGLPEMLLELRSAAVIAAGVWALERVRRRVRVAHWQSDPALPVIR